jgi:hypothetical protein
MDVTLRPHNHPTGSISIFPRVNIRITRMGSLIKLTSQEVVQLLPQTGLPDPKAPDFSL